MLSVISADLIERMRRTLRGRNVVIHVFELWVGLAGIISGVVFFYQPASIDEDALAQTIGRPAAAIWVICYLIAGALIWYGLLRPSPRWETVGLWLLGSATAINGIAIVEVFAWHGIATSVTLLALTVAAWIRAMIVQADTLRLAREHDEGHRGRPGTG